MSETRNVYVTSWNRYGALEITPREIVKETPKLIYYKHGGYNKPCQIRKEEIDAVRWSEVTSLSPKAARKAWLEYAKKQVDMHNEQLEKWYKRIDTLKEG